MRTGRRPRNFAPPQHRALGTRPCSRRGRRPPATSRVDSILALGQLPNPPADSSLPSSFTSQAGTMRGAALSQVAQMGLRPLGFSAISRYSLQSHLGGRAQLREGRRACGAWRPAPASLQQQGAKGIARVVRVEPVPLLRQSLAKRSGGAEERQRSEAERRREEEREGERREREAKRRGGEPRRGSQSRGQRSRPREVGSAGQASVTGARPLPPSLIAVSTALPSSCERCHGGISQQQLQDRCYPPPLHETSAQKDQLSSSQKHFSSSVAYHDGNEVKSQKPEISIRKSPASQYHPTEPRTFSRTCRRLATSL